jgi:hypothetical protein
MERARGSAMANSLSEHVYYSITENIYYSQLSAAYFCSLNLSVFTSYSTKIDLGLSPNVLSPCCLLLPPTCLLVTANEARSYLASTIARNELAAPILCLLITVTGWCGIKRPIHCSHFLIYCASQSQF